MNTKQLDLTGKIPTHEGEVFFTRLEVLADEYSPLALVWYRMRGDQTERATRIDLQKQAFLENMGGFSNDSLEMEARLISELDSAPNVLKSVAGQFHEKVESAERTGVGVYSRLSETVTGVRACFGEEIVNGKRRRINYYTGNEEVSQSTPHDLDFAEMREEPVVNKRARVCEEVVMGRHSDFRKTEDTQAHESGSLED